MSETLDFFSFWKFWEKSTGRVWWAGGRERCPSSRFGVSCFWLNTTVLVSRYRRMWKYWKLGIFGGLGTGVVMGGAWSVRYWSESQSSSRSLLVRSGLWSTTVLFGRTRRKTIGIRHLGRPLGGAQGSSRALAPMLRSGRYRKDPFGPNSESPTR